MAVTFDKTQAAHLLRRAGFGGTQAEIDQLVSLGHEGAVNYLVNYEQVDDSAMENGLTAKNYLEPQTGQQLSVAAIQSWWLYRMFYTKRPLVEKMTLFWHDHFATAVSKVNVREYMLNQNNLFRQYALGNFKDLVLSVSKDPAMIIWLDNNTNIKGMPNENYARELMELFTTGISDRITGETNYTEDDVHASGRAFTGWTLRRGDFFFNSAQHDYDSKTFMGQTGTFNGDDIVNILVNRQATARYISWKLLEWFVYADPEPELIQGVADIYTSNNFDMRAVIRHILLSDAFASDKAVNANIKNPTEFVTGIVRMLKLTAEPRAFLSSMSLMDQVLFNPPTVAGWDWGLSWINTATLLVRYNAANGVATARGQTAQARNLLTFDPKGFMQGQSATTAEDVVDLFLSALGPLQVADSQRQALVDYLNNGGTFTLTDATIDQKVRGLVHLVMSLPEFQLN